MFMFLLYQYITKIAKICHFSLFDFATMHMATVATSNKYMMFLYILHQNVPIFAI